MFKKNRTVREIFTTLLNLLAIIVILFTRTSTAFATPLDWIEVSRTIDGIQYLDKNSSNITSKNIIQITTKYLKIDPFTSETIEDNVYVMKINCKTNKFKDISVNGKNKLSAKWEEPKGDKLLDDVISYSCNNA